MKAADQATLERREREITRHYADLKCLACSEQQGRDVWIREDLWKRHLEEVHHVKEDQTYSGPQFYSLTAQSLIHSQQVKILEFLKARAIEYVGGEFVVHNIPGYNKRVYRITEGEDGEMACNCQFFRKEHKPCSHIGATREWMARGRKYD